VLKWDCNFPYEVLYSVDSANFLPTEERKKTGGNIAQERQWMPRSVRTCLFNHSRPRKILLVWNCLFPITIWIACIGFCKKTFKLLGLPAFCARCSFHSPPFLPTWDTSGSQTSKRRLQYLYLSENRRAFRYDVDTRLGFKPWPK
jgi:hypothetical protein